MERRLVIGMAGVLAMTLLALLAPLFAAPATCSETTWPGPGCDRLETAAAPVAWN